jgi:hypothetical protein
LHSEEKKMKMLSTKVRVAVLGLVAGLLVPCAITACSSDDNSAGSTDAGLDSSTNHDVSTDTWTAPGNDAPSNQETSTETGASPEAGGDGGHDSGPTTGDAGSDAPADASEAGPTTFCQGHPGLTFCDDFDEPGTLWTDGGTGPWTLINGSQSEIALSTAHAESLPNALYANLPSGPGNTDRSARVLETITPANGVTQAIYEFDIYIATAPNAGGFATDFQFLDTSGGSDQFGFRIGVFGNATGFDHADVEHNHPTLGGPDDIISPIPITAGAWNHVKMAVAYSASTGDAGNTVSFQLYLNNATTAAVNANYPAPFAKALFARFGAGMVFAFDANNKNWGIYYDNFTLKLQ